MVSMAFEKIFEVFFGGSRASLRLAFVRPILWIGEARQAGDRECSASRRLAGTVASWKLALLPRRALLPVTLAKQIRDRKAKTGQQVLAVEVGA